MNIKDMKISVSTSLGKPAYKHDIRESIANNVTKELSKNNVILLDALQGKSVDEFIDELLQPSIDQYNEKQKRKDRKINTTYSEWHKLNDNKGEMVYEVVMQIGSHEDLGKIYYENKNEIDRENMRNHFIDVYKKWMDEWQKEHPNLKVLWATIHFDEIEGTPHLHCAFAPICQGFKRGLDTQISLSKSLEADGYERLNTSKEGYQLQRAFEDFRKYQEKDIREYGYKIKERQEHRPHLPVDQFKEMKEMEERVQNMKILEKELKEIEEMERTPSYDPTKVKEVKVKESLFAEPETMIQTTVENFDALRLSADAKSINKKTEEKIKLIQKTTEQALERLSTNQERELKEKVKELEKKVEEQEKTIEEKNIVIQQKTRRIKILENIIDRIEELLRKYSPQLLQVLEKLQEQGRVR